LVSNLSMRNTGDVRDDIIVKVSNVKDLPAGWGANLSYDGSSMAPMAERGIVLSVKAPSNARGEEKVTVRLSASSGASQSVSDNITLNVTVGITRGVRLACPICNGTADPGGPVDYDLLVMNSGNSKDNISLSIETGTMEGWKTELVFDGTNMAMGGTRTGTLTIGPPSDAMNGSVMSLVVQATSLSKPDISSQVTLVTTVGPVFKVGISVPVPEMGAKPGEQVPFPFTIQNSGNAIDEYALEISEPTDGWNAVVQFEKGPMAAGGNRSGTLVVTPSESETADSLVTIDMVVSSIHDGGINATASFTARVLPVHGLYIVEDDGVTSPPETAPGDEALFRFQVLNTGNADDNVTLEVVSSNGWPVRISEWFQGTELHPDESVTMKVLLDVPSDARVGDVAVVTLTGMSGSDPPVIVNCTGQTKVAAFHKFSLIPDEQNAVVEAGSPVTFNLSVVNDGNGDWQFAVDVTGNMSSAASISERTFTLPKGGSRTVAVDIAPSLPVGDHVFTIKVTEGNVTMTANLRVSVLAKTEGPEDGGDAGRDSSVLDWSTWGMLLLVLLIAIVILVGVFARMRFGKMPQNDIARPPATEKGDRKLDAQEGPKETHDLGPPVPDGETDFVELTDDPADGPEGGWD